MRRFIGLFASLMWLSACGNSTSSVALSTRMGSAVTGSALTRTSSQQLALSNGITVDRVRLSVRELELKREGHHDDDSNDDSDAGTDAGTDDKSEHKQRTGSFLIDLSGTALEGQLVRLQDISVDVGTYDEIEFDIGKVDPANATGGLKELADQGASLIIDGHIDGEPFQFVSSLRVEQERKVSFEIVEGDDQNVTFNIDPSGWFTDKDGKRLDPRESSARSQLENNLQKSIDAFDDHDRNGGEDDDDNDRHGGRSGGED